MRVFSTEHPVYLSRATGEGWVPSHAGEDQPWAIHRYADEGPRTESWLTDGVRKYHRTVATLVNGLVDAGLLVDRLLEPMPTLAEVATRPDWAPERERPTFLLLRASKL